MARTAAALPRTRAIERRWRSHSVSLRSPVRAVISWPSSRMNLEVAGPSTPEVFCGLRQKSQYARPDPTRPDPMTLLRSLYLWNGLTDSRAVFFVRCHHSINFTFDRYRYPPVPATARGTCRGEGVEDTLSLGNSTTAGPIAFKFGV